MTKPMDQAEQVQFAAELSRQMLDSIADVMAKVPKDLDGRESVVILCSALTNAMLHIFTCIARADSRSATPEGALEARNALYDVIINLIKFGKEVPIEEQSKKLMN